MNKDELIKYWEVTSDIDYKAMQNLYLSGDYHWVLFMGHLVIEKLLKGCYVKNIDEKVPFTHDLLRIASMAKLIVDDETANSLDLITTFNMSARYPDYKQVFYSKCTKEFTFKNIKKIEEARLWLKEIIKS